MTVSQESPAAQPAGVTNLPEISPIEGVNTRRTKTQRAVADQRSFRPEVQGLRALAVLMVASYHIWFGKVSGGVDIFLLISAFLLSLSFIRKAESGKPLGLRHYWTNMFKRLLPSVVVVIIGILVATRLFVPSIRWSEILEQAWASILYYQNWFLAFQSVDYYAKDHSQASPLQHFWSLSIQGQVFILWPLMFALSALIAKVLNVKFRAVARKVFAVVFVASFTFSIHQTYTTQSFAYFDTRTRLWEFALGTLLAFVIPYISLPKTLRIVLGWVGIVAMLSVGFLLDVQGQFPGYVALWPLAAAAFIIIAGDTKSKFGVDRILASKPLTSLGDISYALYLWHWPVLVIYLIWRDREAVGIVGGTGVLALSLILAYLTTKFIERPMRSMKWGAQSRSRSLVVIVVAMAIVAAPVLTWQTFIQKEMAAAFNAQVAAIGSSDNPGAISLYPGFVSTAKPEAPVIPAATVATEDYFHPDGSCVGDDVPYNDFLKQGCGYVGTLENPEKTIVVVGNSHSQQWTTPLAKIAKDNGWKIITFYRGACRFASEVAGQDTECNTWNAEALKYILEKKPDYVYTTVTAAIPDGGQDTVPSGMVEYVKQVTDAGIEIIGVRDNPRFSFNMIACVEEKGKDDPSCSPSRDKSLNSTPPVEELKRELPDMYFLDMTDQICLPASCPAVIGNVNVYMDDDHITESYMKTLTPVYEKRFTELLKIKK